ncbi:MAG: alanine--tRNA ligase [Sphingobacteriales bacterium]|uniref:alanine--tRNA ligase n=1 Tax=Hydrotalea flava TaxID=714549 RepID=UPI00083233E5|nr:alanine--tRNA ligase [Hydrotalea flava]RTL47286.1 MAG: alanine--tRNA ligase [Sphingobacteriales bacterium]
MLTSAEIRQQFLDFFASKGHKIVPSAPIVLKNDPTLLFTNAGMNQFKDIFLGLQQPAAVRVADTQKCLRVSGKHNDLEEVGVDTYHHTMFEMLGNWSFGDYFKPEAIAWSWELLTNIYHVDKERLYVTVFEGDATEGLPEDVEAHTEWSKWIAPEKILPGNKKDNFWEMGDTGPCGPCTEIHIDCRTDAERLTIDGKTLVNKDHPQVIEIWNNVFIQYNRLKNGKLEPLPAKHVDTGMGLERLVRVIQNKTSNYDTDIFTPTITLTEQITHRKYNNTQSKQDIAFRVIADHIRAIAFTIADGQLPSNSGAGYVVRRILRRAVRYYFSYLQYKQPLLFQLIPALAKQFNHVFPELQQQVDFVVKVIKEEEEAFLRTLDKGLKKMDELIEQAKKTIHTTIDGKSAFELFDTFGFPIDLTKLIAVENNLQVDDKGFEAEMQLQKNRSRAAGTIDADDWVILQPHAFTEFIGYDTLSIETKIVQYRKVTAKGKQAYQVVLNATPFYAESGGQVGDTGWLTIANETIAVTDTRKENNVFIQFTETLPAQLNEPVIASINIPRRKAIMAHHTATHLLHAALRKVLGTHVAQKGSLVNEAYLRFDFSHFAKLTDKELENITALVNEKIRENIPVVVQTMKKEDALKMGAMALFGEKYGDEVRVVIIDPSYSVELCGGTHVGSTGELGIFAIQHETAVAAGVRRIEAVCGIAAEQWMQQQLHTLQEAKTLLKNPKDLLKAIEQHLEENALLKKQVAYLELKQIEQIQEQLLQQADTVNHTHFIGKLLDVMQPDILKKLCFQLKNQLTGNYVVVLAANISGKPHVAVLLSETMVTEKKWDANQLIKQHIAPIIKGSGGGQKTLATAGGQDASNLHNIFQTIQSLL